MHTRTHKERHIHQNAHSYLYMNALECTYTHQNTHRDTQHNEHTLTKLCLNSKQTSTKTSATVFRDAKPY